MSAMSEFNGEIVAKQRESFLREYISEEDPKDAALHGYLRAVIVQWMKSDLQYDALVREVVDTLQRALCAGDDPTVILPQLQEKLSSGGPCGKVMHFGDPTFRCVECALDSTCVMCMGCYNNSAHKREGHTLMVNTSPGTGMCDCGDEEAWKYGSTCSIHESTAEELSNIEMKLPEKIRNIAKSLFAELLNLAWRVYIDKDTHNQTSVFEIPDTLMPTEEDGVLDRYVTVLLNDEYHNFDEVITQFKKMFSCTANVASTMATNIDREGRMKMKEGKKEECDELTHQFLNYKPARNSDKKPLLTRTMLAYSFHLQDVLIEVIDFLAMVAVNPGFRRIICNVSIEDIGQDMTLVESIMLSETHLWKRVKSAWHSVFMGTFLVDPLYKKEFAILLIKNYKAMFSAYLYDTRGREVTFSVVSLTVQLFTVPSISQLLLLEHSAAEVIFTEFLQFYRQYVTTSKDGREKLTSLTASKTRERMQHALTDIKFILSNVPEVVTPAAEAAFLRFFRLFAQFISWMQEMNPHKRESNNHILRDREWDIYFMMEINELNLIMMTVARWCIASPALQRACLDILLNVMNSDSCPLVKAPCPVTTGPAILDMVESLSNSEDTTEWKRSHKKMAGEQIFPLEIRYVNHRMFYDFTSFHIPVSRFIGLIISYVHELQPRISDPAEIYRGYSCQVMLDIPLRPIILSQQIEANLWKRNGSTMDNQASCYRDHYKHIMWDKDLLLLQHLMAACEPNEALLRIVHKYMLEPYFLLLEEGSNNFIPLLRMAEAFASLVLYTVCERHRVNVSDCTDYDIVRKDAIHILATAKLPRSKVMRSLDVNFNNLLRERITRSPRMDEIFEEVAVKVKEDGVKVSMSLKPELYAEVTPFYYHFSHGQRQMVEGNYYSRLAEVNTFTPPPMPRFHRLTARLRDYFISPVMQRFVYVVLKRHSSGAAMVSDLLVHQVVHFVMCGIQDEQSAPDAPLARPFSEVLTATTNPFYLVGRGGDEESIFSLLKGLLKSESKGIVELKPIVRWILRTCDVLTNGASVGDTAPGTQETDTPSSKANDRAARLRKMRMSIMNKFQADQAQFFSENKVAFENISAEELAVEMEVGEGGAEEEGDQEAYVVCGPNKGPVPKPESSTLTCILCYDNEKIDDSSTMMYGCLVEKSVVFKPQKTQLPEGMVMGSLVGGENLHIQSCGHPIHLKCLHSILKNMPFPLVRQILTIAGDRNAQPLYHKGNFSCPYCKMTSNAVVPVVGFDRLVESADVGSEEFLVDIRECSASVEEEEVGEEREVGEDVEMVDVGVGDIGAELASSSPRPFIALFGQYFNYSVEGSVLGGESAGVGEDGRESDDSLNMELKFKEDMRRFYRKVYMTLDSGGVGSRNWGASTIQMVAYTFAGMEFNLRGKPLLSGLAEYQEAFFESFLRSLSRSMGLGDGHLYNTELRKELVKVFRPSSSGDMPSLLNMDVFTVFVAARLVLQRAGKGYNAALTELVVIAEAMKLLLSVKPSSSTPDSGADDPDAIQVATVWGYLRKLAGMAETDDPYPCPTFLLSELKSGLLPLLRKVALFLRYSTCIPGPATLRELQSPEGEFDLLMAYLNLGSLSALLSLGGELKTVLVNRWLTSLDQDQFWGAVEFSKTKREGRLAELPHSFIDLLIRGSAYTCPKIVSGKSRYLAVCLVCGDMVCFQSYCCSEDVDGQSYGPCNVHAHRCSGDLGIFLTLEKCQVLFLPVRSPGMHYIGPYVDKYGESFKSSRNKAMTLSDKLYKKIEQMWVKHEIRPLVSRNSDSEYGPRIDNIGRQY